ncbi:TonB-dependent receptor [Massilia sp. SR12]
MRVEVKAASTMQQRRNDTAGRIVVSRDELLRYGDATLADTLRRQPGVAQGGGGRTQFLLNGEPAPPGFSPDSLAPELIERVEILRSASADSSTQGIAGSINIILRRSGARARSQLALGAKQAGAAWGPDVGLDLSRPGDGYAASLALRAAREHAAGADSIVERTPLSERRTLENNSAVIDRLGLVPRVSWQFGGGSKLAWQGLLDHSRNRNRGSAQEALLRGDASDFPLNAYQADARTRIGRSELEGSYRLGDAAGIDWKAGVAQNRRNSDYVFSGSSAAGSALWSRHVISSAADGGASSSGKLRMAGENGHALAAGWDGSLSRRSEGRRQEDADAAGASLALLDQRYTARVRRLAAYVQDEWSLSSRIEVYVGLRWEGLRTQTNGRDLADVRSTSSVWSPVAHVLWRLPDSRDQVRLGLARSYKAPNTRDLVPRRFTVNNGNGPTNPDLQGNPALRPELAWGLDAAYERYFGKESMFSVAVHQRRIANVIQPVLFEEKGKWVATPQNIGNASTRGLELDWRMAQEDGTSLRLGLARNWSRVESVPGSGNRLGEQVPLTLNAALDLRLAPGLRAGLNWNLQQGGLAHTSATQWSGRGAERRLDVNAMWTPRPGLALRATVGNALRPATHSTQLFDDGQRDTLRTVIGTGQRALRFALELAL